jgi:multimeric flavodoxin WrbA
LPEPESPLVLAVVGSPRSRGNTTILVDVVLEELARRGIRAEKIMPGERRSQAGDRPG